MTALTQDLDRTDESVPLSQRLREGTRPEHEQAEGSGFVERLMSGQLDEPGALGPLVLGTRALAQALGQRHGLVGAVEVLGESSH